VFISQKAGLAVFPPAITFEPVCQTLLKLFAKTIPLDVSLKPCFLKFFLYLYQRGRLTYYHILNNLALYFVNFELFPGLLMYFTVVTARISQLYRESVLISQILITVLTTQIEGV